MSPTRAVTDSQPIKAPAAGAVRGRDDTSKLVDRERHNVPITLIEQVALSPDVRIVRVRNDPDPRPGR
ncbi:hypothetical protein [Bosea sp. FBZP-16]|uniref:hypothetical protein n=1 Tax=Bosea sp. FBZP-16 TaxID=2065382 RepID=UPI000C3106D3|nr:hypothetical protein [Bosea sp. FBZP-16]